LEISFVKMSENIDRRIARTTLAAGAAALPTIVAASANPIDPLLLAVEASKAARKRWLDETERTGGDHDALYGVSNAAYETALRTLPTTIQGASALAEHNVQREEDALDPDVLDALEALVRETLVLILEGGGFGRRRILE
jgi:hypothetical protein